MTLSLDLHLPMWHVSGAGDAQFSADRSYRYRLHRRWDVGPSLMVIELRPSGANEHRDDDASRRAAAFARGFGYGACTSVCLYAAVATDDAHPLTSISDPVGPDNDWWIEQAAYCHDVIVFAWGGAATAGRANAVASRVWQVCQETSAAVAVVGWTSEGQPCGLPGRHRSGLGCPHAVLSTLTAHAHTDFGDVDPRWSALLADTHHLVA